ncbi:hypothetical protein [Streptomyces europaeiscabiei]|nr:hypothetical protein [Streptomyces europaeiscabiei]MDX3861878.1 hypothetical protein [Streptomyces europaeiscabiei]
MKPSPPPAMSGRHWKERLRHRFGTTALDAARILLADLLDDLGGAAAVQRREVRPPR